MNRRGSIHLLPKRKSKFIDYKFVITACFAFIYLRRHRRKFNDNEVQGSSKRVAAPRSAPPDDVVPVSEKQEMAFRFAG